MDPTKLQVGDKCGYTTGSNLPWRYAEVVRLTDQHIVVRDLENHDSNIRFNRYTGRLHRGHRWTAIYLVTTEEVIQQRREALTIAKP